ncbi:MAG: gliding motility-associated protein GldE [Flavobacteriales bacterium]|nr:gliding motility-associated protein GldE [Flavobacteriales bacterium]MCB9365132.1 gliding motility-associated protein GldE [Flavobacteriales bacterium]
MKLDEPSQNLLILAQQLTHSFNVETLAYLLVLIVLIIFSALVSGSEVALFSLNPTEKELINNGESKPLLRIKKLLTTPKKLLATILVANNFINIAIILLSTITIESLIDFKSLPGWLVFMIQAIGITFIILLFGEVIPKVYATKNALTLAQTMSSPLNLLMKIFNPISKLLIFSTSIFDKRIKRKSHDITVEELSHALDLTNDITNDNEEHRILKGIVQFGETNVSEVMRARVNVVAVEKNTPFNIIISTILDSGHSRIPVYDDSFDKILGVLYIKDLIPHINNNDDFEWLPLIRSPFFVPENKKLDDLLKEFQERKIHLAIVVDEYGGTSGIITLEDVIEEIVGEISDEFDEEDIAYSKIDDNTYVFDANTSINDVSKVVDLEDSTPFTEMKKEADTLAGLIIEVSGKIPQKNEKINFLNFSFTVEASDKRRIKRVKMVINENHNDVKNA